MAWAVVAVTAVSAGVQIYQANKNRKAAEKAADEAKAEQAKQQAELDKQKAEYKNMKFENPYENMENVAEDLTVNQQQAQMQTEQGQQQRANIMSQMRGAAGGSGIAGLAQSMANQGQLATQRISASIGQQEAANQRAKAAGASRIQGLERKGQQMKQEFEINRQSTLLGMQMGTATGANQAARTAEQQSQAADAAYTESIVSGVSSVGGAAAGGASARQAGPEAVDQTQMQGSYGNQMDMASQNARSNQQLRMDNTPNTELQTFDNSDINLLPEDEFGKPIMKKINKK